MGMGRTKAGKGPGKCESMQKGQGMAELRAAAGSRGVTLGQSLPLLGLQCLF